MQANQTDPNDRHANTLKPWKWRSGYHTLSTTSNGDCLFHAVHLALLTPLGREAYTSFELRHNVARTVLNERDAIALAAMHAWREALRLCGEDQVLLLEYGFALPLSHLKNDREIDTHTRQKLFVNMLDPRIYWGDQYAICVLQRLLNVRIVVFEDGVQMRGVEDPPGFRPSWVILLELDGQHYRPIVRVEEDGHTVRTCYKAREVGVLGTSFSPCPPQNRT